MRDSIRRALEHSAELTRDNKLVKAVQVAEGAFARALDTEHPEIQQWLSDHREDFVREPDREDR